MPRRYRLLSIFLSCLAGGAALAQDPPLAVEAVAPGVFVHFGQIELMSEANEGGTANLAFILGNSAVAVIDSGGSARQGRRLLATIREHTDLPLAFVINTHGHPDHIFGNVAFEEVGALRIGHENLESFLAARGDYYLRSFAQQLGVSLIEEIRILPPDETVAHERLLDLGDRTLRLQAWPSAHSDSDLTVLDSESGILFAGDLIFVEHIPVIDGSLLGYLEVTRELSELQAQQVVPGHGPLAPWPDAAQKQLTYLEALAADLRAEIAKGTPLERAVETAGNEEAKHWALREAYHQRNATVGYVELEWE